MSRDSPGSPKSASGPPGPLRQPKPGLLARLLDYAPLGIAVLDSKERILDWNRFADVVLGLGDDAVGSSLIRLFAPEERKILSEMLQSCLQGEISSPTVLRCLPRSKGVDFVEVNATRVPGEQEEHGILVFLQDVSERRKAGERFRRVVEASPSAMLMVDDNGIMTLVNGQMETLFGYGWDELLGQPVEMLVPAKLRQRHSEHRTGFYQAPATRAMGAGRDLFGLHKDGREVPIEIGLNPIQTREGEQVLASIIDNTERIEAAKQTMASLQEKELLLREIHHRVKNNLAVVGSLFYLQSTTTEDEETLRILQDCRDRVRSMALVHEQLYRSEDLASVDFRSYTKDLVQKLFQNYGSEPSRIHLELDFDETSLGIDRAIPCGLILTELVSNALKHAFPEEREGKLRIAFQQQGSAQRVLSVADDGVGLPAGAADEGWQSLGMRLVNSLAQQLDGEFELLRRSPGTEARLILEVPHAS